MDKFPEAFERFERVVDVDRIRSFDHLLVSFSHWAGRNWKGTRKQVEALRREAVKRDIPVPREVVSRRVSREPHFRVEKAEAKTWRFEWVEVHGKPQPRYRDKATGRFIRKPEG